MRFWRECPRLRVRPCPQALPGSKSSVSSIVSSFWIRIFVAWLALHFFLVVTFAVRDAASVLPGDFGVFPGLSNQFWRSAEAVASTVAAERLPLSSPVRQTVAAYANYSGIETGYSYFAPTVPGNGKLVFEIHYPDGRIDYDVPHVGGEAAGYRLATLVDSLPRFHYVPLRDALIKMLVYANWQKHPDATMIRAVFGMVNLPSMAEFKAGKTKSYDVLYSYDFRFRSKIPEPTAP